MTTNIIKQALKRLSLQEKASDVKSRLARLESNLGKALAAAVVEAPSEEDQRAAATDAGGEDIEIYSWVCKWNSSMRSALNSLEILCLKWVELENAYRSCLTTADKRLLGESEVLFSCLLALLFILFSLCVFYDGESLVIFALNSYRSFSFIFNILYYSVLILLTPDGISQRTGRGDGVASSLKRSITSDILQQLRYPVHA
jgi:hypothetical protein